MFHRYHLSRSLSHYTHKYTNKQCYPDQIALLCPYFRLSLRMSAHDPSPYAVVLISSTFQSPMLNKLREERPTTTTTTPRTATLFSQRYIEVCADSLPYTLPDILVLFPRVIFNFIYIFILNR